MKLLILATFALATLGYAQEITSHTSTATVSTPSVFRYYGRVTDLQGKPIANARVVFGMSLHPNVQTYEDDHSYPETRTDKNGRYEIELSTPWVRGMDAEAKGYARRDLWDDSDTPSYRPGRYNFTLKKAPSEEELSED